MSPELCEANTGRPEGDRQQYGSREGLLCPLSTVERSSRKKMEEETSDLNNTLDQTNSDVYRTFWPTAAKYTVL